jgi:hypothetical protein
MLTIRYKSRKPLKLQISAASLSDALLWVYSTAETDKHDVTGFFFEAKS